MTKNHEVTSPDYIEALIEACGGNAAEAGRRMGVSGSVLSKAMRNGETRVVNDLAAKAVLDEIEASGEVGAKEVRRMMHKVAIYMSRTPALEMPSDLFDMLGKTVAEVSKEHMR